MIRRVLLFIAGLVLAILFGLAGVAALGSTALLVEVAIDSHGEPAHFEARIRHFTDSIETADDGRWIVHQRRHPVAIVVSAIAGAWIATIALAKAIDRVSRVYQRR